MSHADEFAAEPDQLGGETIQRGLIHNSLFQQSVARTQSLSISLQQRQICWMRLREQQIQKTSPRARRSFDKLKVFRAKDNHAESSQIIGEFANRLIVQTQLPLGRGPIHLDLMLPLPHDLASNKITLLAMT